MLVLWTSRKIDWYPVWLCAVQCFSCHPNGVLQEGVPNRVSQSLSRKLDDQSESYQQRSSSYLQECTRRWQRFQRRAHWRRCTTLSLFLSEHPFYWSYFLSWSPWSTSSGSIFINCRCEYRVLKFRRQCSRKQLTSSLTSCSWIRWTWLSHSRYWVCYFLAESF